MIYSENALNILTTKTYRGIGRAWIVKNLKGNENIQDIVNLLDNNSKEIDSITIEEFERRKRKIEENIERLNKFTDGVIALGDKNFPQYRGDVKNSEQPIFLFYRGDISLLQLTNKNIAVIGLLNPDNSTEKNEKEVVSKLVKNKATIVSGLALGCDTIAHKQTLDSGGKTIAILPGPLNDIIPATNKELSNEIVKNGGLLITEYYEDANSKMEMSGRYQERDRLQALFSDCVILTASYEKNNLGNDSGSRLAMEYALKYSIPRAVIYDSIADANNPKYDLNRQLINEEKEIILINKNNLSSAISRVITLKAATKQLQPNLFNFI